MRLQPHSHLLLLSKVPGEARMKKEGRTWRQPPKDSSDPGTFGQVPSLCRLYKLWIHKFCYASPYQCLILSMFFSWPLRWCYHLPISQVRELRTPWRKNSASPSARIDRLGRVDQKTYSTCILLWRKEVKLLMSNLKRKWIFIGKEKINRDKL